MARVFVPIATPLVSGGVFKVEGEVPSGRKLVRIGRSRRKSDLCFVDWETVRAKPEFARVGADHPEGVIAGYGRDKIGAQTFAIIPASATLRMRFYRVRLQ